MKTKKNRKRYSQELTMIREIRKLFWPELLLNIIILVIFIIILLFSNILLLNNNFTISELSPMMVTSSGAIITMTGRMLNMRDRAMKSIEKD